MAANATKKSFSLRMSKKVAELTQVVHMLFMKHHEKELELEALKDAYEHEIDLVIADARGQLDALTRKLDDREERLRATKPEMEMEKEKGNEEDQMKIEALEKSLEAEKVESQRMRDLLTLSKNDIETLRTLNAQQLSEHSEHMSEKSKEIGLLKLHVADLERLTRYSESQTSHVVDSLRKTVETLSGQTTQLREELSNSENLRETLANRNKNLENDVQRLKRELAKRSSLPDVDNARQQNVGIPANTETIMRKPNYDREIQRLKQEIQRYRMELTNRETNYNRRFADSQPILVHRRPINDRTSAVANGHSSKNAELFNNHHGNPMQSSVHFGQERAVTGRKLREVSHQSYSDDLVSTSASVSPSMVRSTSSTTSERLPQLDSRLSIRRPVLARPQPSKLLLSKRSTNWTASHV